MDRQTKTDRSIFGITECLKLCKQGLAASKIFYQLLLFIKAVCSFYSCKNFLHAQCCCFSFAFSEVSVQNLSLGKCFLLPLMKGEMSVHIPKIWDSDIQGASEIWCIANTKANRFLICKTSPANEPVPWQNCVSSQDVNALSHCCGYCCTIYNH